LPLPGGRPRYLPAEDTDLLMEALEHFSGDSCLEIGFGSGAVLASASGRFRLAVGTDVVGLEEARLATRAGVQLVLADTGTCFRDRVFDVVFFNPPYLPSETIEDQAVDGGPTGVEVPVSFLREGLRVLREEGVIVALLSTEGDVGSFLAHCRSLGLQVEPIAEKRLFYETLSVFRIQRGEGGAGTRQSQS
jgi:release factor glutamine methyltransferase